MSSSRLEVEITKIGEYTGHKGSIFALVADAAGRYAYTSGDDGVVARWDLQGPEDLGSGVIQTDSAVYALTLAPVHNYLIAGGSNGTVYLIDLAKQAVVHTHRKTEGAIYGLAYEAERDLLWMLHAQGALSVLRLSDFSERGYARIAQNHLRSIEAMPNGTHWLIGSSDHHIYYFNRQSGQVEHYWPAHENSVFALRMHQAGHYLLSGGRDALLKVWDQRQQFQLVRSIPAHNFTVNDIAIHPGGDYFVTASRDKTLKIWDAYQFELLKVVDFARNEAHIHRVNRLVWKSQDNSLLSCSDDRRLLRWRITVSK